MRHTGEAQRRRTNPKSFLVRLYCNMLGRCVGYQTVKADIYRGLPLLPKTVFYAWALGCQEFWTLWFQWCAAGHPRSLAPSVDRKDSKKGYTLDNMQWLTMGENSAKANVERWRMNAV